MPDRQGVEASRITRCLLCDRVVLWQRHSEKVATVQSHSSLSRYSARSVSDRRYPTVIKYRAKAATLWERACRHELG